MGLFDFFRQKKDKKESITAENPAGNLKRGGGMATSNDEWWFMLFYGEGSIGEITITGYKAEERILSIPSVIYFDSKNIPVTKINGFIPSNKNGIAAIRNQLEVGIFSGRNVTEIIIPDSVRTIGYCAFSENVLENVFIPESVTLIDYFAFYKNRLKQIHIPESIKKINSNAFVGNPLEKIIIGADVELSVNTDQSSFSKEFDSFYSLNSKKAGVYTFDKGKWEFHEFSKNDIISKPEIEAKIDFIDIIAIKPLLKDNRKILRIDLAYDLFTFQQGVFIVGIKIKDSDGFSICSYKIKQGKRCLYCELFMEEIAMRYGGKHDIEEPFSFLFLIGKDYESQPILQKEYKMPIDDFNAILEKWGEKQLSVNTTVKTDTLSFNNWDDFISAVNKSEEADDVITARSIMNNYPVQFWFYIIFKKYFNEKSGYKYPPFNFTKYTVLLAKKYKETGYKPSGFISAMLPKNYSYYPDYIIRENNQVARMASPFDGGLKEVFSFLKGRMVRGDQETAQAVYDAIIHYAHDIPVVSYFFSLPYLTAINTTSSFEEKITELDRSILTGLEIFLHYVYDALGSGESITDEFLTGIITPYFILEKEINDLSVNTATGGVLYNPNAESDLQRTIMSQMMNKSITSGSGEKRKTEIDKIIRNKDVWICGRCDTENNLKLDFCKKCGKEFNPPL